MFACLPIFSVCYVALYYNLYITLVKTFPKSFVLCGEMSHRVLAYIASNSALSRIKEIPLGFSVGNKFQQAHRGV